MSYGITEWEYETIGLEVLRASGAELPKRCETGKSHPYLLECYRCGAAHGQPCLIAAGQGAPK